MRSVNYAAAPFGYFSPKHADKIAVQLNGIDYVKREKQQTNTSEIKDNLIDAKRQMATCGRRWLRKQVQNRERENGIQHKENPNPDESRPKFVSAKISVPRLLSGKARRSCRLLHLPMFKSNAEISPAKSRQREGRE